MDAELTELRKRLDALDQALVGDLAAREELVAQIARVKAQGAGAVRDMEREEELLTRIVARARAAGLQPDYVTRLFREILDHSVRNQQERLVDRNNPARAGQRSVTVAYQGTEGAYSHLAATRHFSARQLDQVEFRGFDSFAEMLQAVRDRAADYGVLPIENTTAGSINESYDLLARMDLAIVGEEIQRIDHCLLAIEDVPLGRIRRIYSHPKALDQCTVFLSELKHCQIESFANTAMAARKIRDDQDLSQAAIAGEAAARLYGLAVLRRDIADQKDNFTRFVIVAPESIQMDPRIACKTSLLFAARHEDGALVNSLNVLARHKLNLTKLESRPRPGAPWEYLFYVDFEGNIAEPGVKSALEEFAGTTNFVKIFGSYPARTTSKPAQPRPAAGVEPDVSDLDDAPTSNDPHPDVLQALEKKPYKLVARSARGRPSEFRVGDVVIGGPRSIVIAGPCSVESRDQIHACAQIARQCGAHILRGGCFKPRTSPYAFQGLGYEGLDLLCEAGRAAGLPVVTEVMHPADLDAVAKKADMIQLGARNMQNFSLLKEIGRINRPVILKRGMMASIDEWLAAAEYILAHGNQQVILCERGIRTFETATRNTLDLSAVPVAKELTHLPVLVDPSHACGTWRWVPAMTEAALAAGADGVMIEIHPEPAKALSDGPQSLNFDVFRKLMQRVSR